MAPRSSLQRVGQLPGHSDPPPHPAGQRESEGFTGRYMDLDRSTTSIRSGRAFRVVTRVLLCTERSASGCTGSRS